MERLKTWYANWYVARPHVKIKKLASHAYRNFLRFDTASFDILERMFFDTFDTFDHSIVLKIAQTLPSDHPGWRLLSVMAKRTEYPSRVMERDVGVDTKCLQRLCDRMVAGEFWMSLPYVVDVWIECRLKVNVPPHYLVFPLGWKYILKNLNLDASTRQKIDMIYFDGEIIIC